MLERFLGKHHGKSSLPKNQIEVVCPVCGAVQIEPRLVVTTFCRKCGEHLRIENRRVIASSRINPVPSAIYPAEQEKEKAETPTAETPPAPVVSAAPARWPKPAPKREASDPSAPLGFGDMLGIEKHQEESAPELPFPPAENPPAENPPEPESIPEASEAASDTLSHETDSAPASSPQRATPAASQSTLHRMKEQGQFRQHYFKEVECFDCHNKFKVGRSAKTTGCPACGATICLEDFDINISSTAPIRTRGDVLIRKTANVTTSEIFCRDLRVFGIVSARIDCTGEFLIRCSGTIVGEITCRKLVVEKGCDVHVINVIHAGEVDIRARIFANIHCTGAVHISPTGWVHGDVTARSVSIEPGGQLDGSMNILRSTPSVLSSIIAAPAGSQPIPPLVEKSA